MALPALATAAKQAVQMAAKDPRIAAKVNEYVSKATNGRFSNVTSFSTNTPANQAIAIAAVRSAGGSVADIWSGIDTARLTSAERRIFDATLNAHNMQQQALDAKFGVPVTRDPVRDLQDKAMTQWAISHFGSTVGARRAHAHLRAFLSTDSDDLESLIKVFGTP